jgi:Zn-finger nucleic acid-binding protein
MRSFERSGITVEQCKSCRGVFSRPGRLDRLMAARPASSVSSRSTNRRPSNAFLTTTHRGARFRRPQAIGAALHRRSEAERVKGKKRKRTRSSTEFFDYHAADTDSFTLRIPLMSLGEDGLRQPEEASISFNPASGSPVTWAGNSAVGVR